MIVLIDVPDEIGPTRFNAMSVSDKARLVEAFKKGVPMHGHIHPVNAPGDLPDNIDPDVASFYADDQKLLDSIGRTQFAPVKDYKYERAPMWPPTEWYWFLYRLWFNNIQYWPYQVRDGVSNMVSWFKLIWNLRDWDNFHLYAIMLKQLQAMQVGCRATSTEGPHHKALDRCAILLAELIERGQCNCDVLHGISLEEDPAVSDARRKKCMQCYVEQKAMLEEFGKLFAAFSQSWWD